MRKRIVNILKRAIRSTFSPAIQKRLGYPRDAKLLIIHADDLGLSGTENAATFEAMRTGVVNSGSVMVNCPGFQEVTKYANENPDADIGIHLTLTSEWDSYKWKPVLPNSDVPHIIDENGFLYKDNTYLNKAEVINDIQRECRAQIRMALKSGIDVTHLDSHMFTMFSNIKILQIYKALGREFRLPVLLTKELPVKTLVERNAIIVDQLIYAEPEDYAKGLPNYYSKALKSLRPGLNCLLVHVAFNDEEMRQITGDSSDYGSDWRKADFDFFTSEHCRKLIVENKIQLITWREIRDKLIR